ncbi:hypothetical protein GBAR_LOCUS31544 [Geodia barretti]|uniref:Uncharacterized protein n=1 Tax=Geodia barretti TaxID=519541 RepID=A0AA35U0M0_GEOBA|nr:hypothetical protein GBAR_LOCUS31544 [Geodia barretti]
MCSRGGGRDKVDKRSRDCSDSCGHCIRFVVTSPYIQPV